MQIEKRNKKKIKNKYNRKPIVMKYTIPTTTTLLMLKIAILYMVGEI